MQSKFFEQALAWQDRAAKAANPQIDMALRALNLPSREQNPPTLRAHHWY